MALSLHDILRPKVLSNQVPILNQRWKEPGSVKVVTRKTAEKLISWDVAKWADKEKTALLHTNSDRIHNRELPNQGTWNQDVMTATAVTCLARYEAERAHRVKTAPGSHTEAEWKAVVEKFGNRCLRCGASGDDVTLTKDHIDPLANGGSHFASNLQPLCGPCNSWKGDREIDFRPSALMT